MRRHEVLTTLRAHQAELQAAGLLHVRIFGSVARDEATSSSDVDLLFEHDEARTFDLFRAYGFEDRLSEIVGARVHLSSARYMKPHIREQALPEAIDAF